MMDPCPIHHHAEQKLSSLQLEAHRRPLIERFLRHVPQRRHCQRCHHPRAFLLDSGFKLYLSRLADWVRTCGELLPYLFKLGSFPLCLLKHF